MYVSNKTYFNLKCFLLKCKEESNKNMKAMGDVTTFL